MDPGPVRERKRDRPYRWYAYVATIVLVPLAMLLVIVAVPHLLPFHLFRIVAGSMTPTLISGDYMVARMRAFGPADLKRGQVLVYEPPRHPGILYVHRLVGLPGEVVEIRDKQVLINGKPLDEPYKIHETELDREAWAIVREGGRIGPAEREAMEKRGWKRPTFSSQELFNWGPYLVPEGAVLLLGDNRDNSRDGRVEGPVPLENLRGYALRVAWSRRPGKPLDIRWSRIGAPIE